MSLNSLNIKPKCYKVIVNLLDSNSAYQAKDFTEQLKLDNTDITSLPLSIKFSVSKSLNTCDNVLFSSIRLVVKDDNV